MKTIIKSNLLIIDPELPPIPDGVVVIDGDKISDVGSFEKTSIPEDSRIIDCTKDTVMPGLIDSHCHITANSIYRETLKEQRELNLATSVLRGAMNLKSDLLSGVTSMRTLGDREDLELRFRDAIEEDLIPGPRLVICIRALRPSHGTAPFLGVATDGPDELKKKIRENFSMGARVIKLFVTNVSNGISAEDYRRGDLTQIPAYTREEIFTAVGEAHYLGMKVAGHAIGGPGMRWAMEAGIDSVEHANMLEEEDIEYFVKYGTRLSDPNLQLFFDKETGFQARENYKQEWWKRKVIESRELTARNMPLALKAGVKFSLAVDSTHSYLWKEGKYFVELGASNKEALLSLTKNSAELLGIEDMVGTLERGKYADVISVRGNPLEDITALRSVGLVMKAGKEYSN